MNKRGINLDCSGHAKIRIKERMGITDKREIKAITKKVFYKGLCMKRNYIPRDTLKWIDNKVNDNYFGRGNNWRIYKEYLFLYSKSLMLITVLDIPKDLIPRKSIEELRRW